MANVDLHGIEVKRIASPQPPLSVGPTSVVGLIGAAPAASPVEADLVIGAGNAAFMLTAGNKARLVIGAGNAAFMLTADAIGATGDEITASIVDGAAIAVAVTGKHIQITADVGTSTAAQVLAAVNADAEAAALVTAALAAGSTGASAVAALAETALAGGATEDTIGAAGNSITASIVDGAAIAVAVTGKHIQITADVGTSTAAAVLAAVNADAEASALVTAALAAGSNGTGAVAALAETALAGGEDNLLLNKATLLTTAAQIAGLGEDGSLPAAVRDVFRTAGRGGATVVVVRTLLDAAATLAGTRAARTGVYALLSAESETGQRPRLLAAPGAKDAAVTTALQAVAKELRAIGVVTLTGADAAAAVTDNPDESHVYAVWPELVIADGTREVARPADGLVCGHIVRTDREDSFAASPSNRQMLGVLRPAVGVEWAVDSRTATANVLNQGNVATVIRRGNAVYLWGNRLSSGGFVTTRRAEDIISDQVALAALDYLDRRVDLPFVEHILGRLNGYLRGLVVHRHIRAGRAWFDTAFNTQQSLSAGQVTFSYEITPNDIAEHIIFRASIGNVPNEVLTELTQGA